MTEAGDINPSAKRAPARTAMRFVVLLGIVSLFGDMTYEGARSVTGPYLQVLGASGTVVGIVAGFGELVGYGLRLVSGYISDRTRRYWPVTLVGYGINLLAVPALALTGRWEYAAVLMIAERVGRRFALPPATQCCRTQPPRWDAAGASVFTKRWTKPAP